MRRSRRSKRRSLAVLSLIGGLLAIVCLYRVFAGMSRAAASAPALRSAPVDLDALRGDRDHGLVPAVLVSRRPADERSARAGRGARRAGVPDVGVVAAAPGPDGDRRLSPAVTAASGRMIVIGAFLAALSIGLRSQTVWFTVPLLVLVLFDRIGRGVAGALIGGSVMFVAGGLAWGIPLADRERRAQRVSRRARHAGRRGFRRRRDAVSQSESARRGVRVAADVRRIRGTRPRWRSSCCSSPPLDWCSCCGAIDDRWPRSSRSPARTSSFICCSRTRRSSAMRCRSFRRSRFSRSEASSLVSVPAVPVVAALVSIAGVAIASPVLVAYGAEAESRGARASTRCRRKRASTQPGALAMHQTFVRPLEAEDVGVAPQLPSPPRLEWLELVEVLADRARPSRSGFSPIPCAAIWR